jgi:type IV pilus assembly protein PilQ
MHPCISRLALVAPMVAALAVSLAAGAPARNGSGTETPALRSISSRLDGALSTVLIEASEPVAYLTSQPDPLTVLVDLRHVAPGSLTTKPIADMLEPVGSVKVETAYAPDGAPVARVRVNLERAAKHRVRSARNTILVEVDRNAANTTRTNDASAKVPTLAPVRPSAPQTQVTAEKPRVQAQSGDVAKAAKKATQLRSVRIGAIENGYAVTLAGNGSLVAAQVDETSDMPHRVFLDFAGVAAGSAPAVTPVNNDGIERVRVATNSREPLITRVVIDLARKIPYTVETVGEELRVLFKKAMEKVADTAAVITEQAVAAPIVEPAAVAPVAAAPAGAVAPVTVNVAPTPDVPSMSNVPSMANVAPVSAAPVAAIKPAAPLFQDVPPAAQALLAAAQTQNSQGPRVFTGDPITLDFQGADLRAVLRTFAEISQGLNIVIDPSIQGTVDVSLRDVPWDQALDIILRANKLGYSVEGNIVRIVPLSALAAENEERRKLAEAQALAGELRVLTRAVSYAKAAELVPVITRSALSARGDVQVDGRTNTLIIRDLADRLTAADELISRLDRPQPQVEIEARIVQLNRDKSRDLGIQWNFGGRVDPAIGTTTGLAFPNRGAVDVGTGAVNTASPSAIGIVLGSVNGAVDLNVQLRALESEGAVKILSTPRVTTQNNIPAEITQGAQIPIQVVSNNTVTVSFKDAALTLRVTPQITASNTVIMNIFLENATPDYSETSPAQPIPAINTQRAVTSVLMGDGDTTVIGGIFTKLESLTEQRTPFLHRVPLLGWLFKTETRLDDNRELLIFITPRIAK